MRWLREYGPWAMVTAGLALVVLVLTGMSPWLAAACAVLSAAIFIGIDKLGD